MPVDLSPPFWLVLPNTAIPGPVGHVVPGGGESGEVAEVEKIAARGPESPNIYKLRGVEVPPLDNTDNREITKMAPSATQGKPQPSMPEVDRMLVEAGPGTHFELDYEMIQGRKQLVWKNVSHGLCAPLMIATARLPELHSAASQDVRRPTLALLADTRRRGARAVVVP